MGLLESIFEVLKKILKETSFLKFPSKQKFAIMLTKTRKLSEKKSSPQHIVHIFFKTNKPHPYPRPGAYCSHIFKNK